MDIVEDARMRTGASARSVTVSAFSVLFAFSLVATAVAETAIDPQSLVGEWNGSWIDKMQGKNNGQYSLTIEKVEGDKVSGRGVVSGRRTTEFNLAGTLHGNQLSFGRDIKTNLTIDGTRMSGTSDGPNASRNITLTKQK